MLQNIHIIFDRTNGGTTCSFWLAPGLHLGSEPPQWSRHCQPRQAEKVHLEATILGMGVKTPPFGACFGVAISSYNFQIPNKEHT